MRNVYIVTGLELFGFGEQNLFSRAFSNKEKAIDYLRQIISELELDEELLEESELEKKIKAFDIKEYLEVSFTVDDSLLVYIVNKAKIE